MIADNQAKARFDVISGMSAQIADLERQLAEMTADRNNQQTRAIRAEAHVRLLEQQLVNPAREVKSLYSHVTREADQEKFDKELSRMTSAGWTFFDSGIIPGADPARFVTLIRVAPITAEPEKTAAPAHVAETVVAPAAPTVNKSLTIATPAIKTEAEFQADLGTALRSTMDHIRRTNPFFGYQPRPFREIMEGRA